MNTLKTVVVTVILMAVGYGVYVSLWQKPEQTAAEKSSGTPALPTVQIPGQDTSSVPPPSIPLSSAGTQPPSVPLRDGVANSLPPTPGTLGSQAPLFGSNSPSGIPGNSTAKPNKIIEAQTLPDGSTRTIEREPVDSSNNGAVKLIPGPHGEKPPTTPWIPASEMSSGSNQPAAASPNSPPTQDAFRDNYLSYIQHVQQILDDDKLAEALQSLTSFYELPNLPEPQRREVEQLLDQLAGTVIYSRQSYLEPLYTVQPSDTLDSIADRCGVPALLLARINGVAPQQLQPGQSLKVLRGPFTAVVSLNKHEMLLKLQGGYYAGRFPVGVGTDCPKLEGTYTVQVKTQRPIYHGPDGINFSADDGRNPLGKFWIGLGDRIGLHGVIDEAGVGRDDNRGTICLKDRDINDVFGILSVGSRVVIQR
jgi:LysM repeat protein